MMKKNSRKYSDFANAAAIATLETLIASVGSPTEYQAAMRELGKQLGNIVGAEIPSDRRCLVVSTAEDADYLANGVMESLEHKHETLAAVFWNNHYSIKNSSVAPIVHQYIQPGFESADEVILIKSIISTSCVVRTNILFLIESINVSRIYVVAPVMYFNAQESLCSEFPPHISNKFRFVFFAVDEDRTESGNVVPGIGGQVYQLLGMDDQPARTGYLPDLVKRLAAL